MPWVTAEEKARKVIAWPVNEKGEPLGGPVCKECFGRIVTTPEGKQMYTSARGALQKRFKMGGYGTALFNPACNRSMRSNKNDAHGNNKCNRSDTATPTVKEPVACPL